jgi:hypothetical protein
MTLWNTDGKWTKQRCAEGEAMCVADVISLKQVDPWKYALRIIDLTIGKV